MTDIPTAETSCTVHFDSLASAAEGLLTVVLDARVTDFAYRFGGLSAAAVLSSGLHLEGHIDEVKLKLEQVPGAILSPE